MGLCNEDRIEGLYYSINELFQIKLELEKVNSYHNLSPLIKELDNLWFAFLKNQNNAAHWILGSDSENKITNSSTSPWALVVRKHIEDVRKKDNSPDLPFDLGNFLNTHNFLVHADKEAANIFRVYQYTESVIYYLRRYIDEFTESFSKLDKIICNIQGFCFNYMKGWDCFAKAYVLNQICQDNNLYDFKYIYDKNDKNIDPVTKWFIDDHIFHNISVAMENDLSTLIEWHKEFKESKKTNLDRLKLIIKLIGRRFNDEYAHNKMKKACSSIYSKNKKLIDALIKECMEKSEEHKNDYKYEPEDIY